MRQTSTPQIFLPLLPSRGHSLITPGTQQRLAASPTPRLLATPFSTSAPRRDTETSESAPEPVLTAEQEMLDKFKARPRPVMPELQPLMSTKRPVEDFLPEAYVEKTNADIRLPKSIQANYYEPLRRKITHGIPVCDIQFRSFSVRNLEFMCDFALRAAYYAKLPVKGPVPLPNKVERWTVPRSNFVHKKSQENFERVTHKRLIQIQDGHPESVELWLAFLRQHQYYGVGMKANIFRREPIRRFPITRAMSRLLTFYRQGD